MHAIAERNKARINFLLVDKCKDMHERGIPNNLFDSMLTHQLDPRNPDMYNRKCLTIDRRGGEL